MIMVGSCPDDFYALIFWYEIRLKEAEIKYDLDIPLISKPVYS